MSNPTFLYEVNLSVQAAYAKEFSNWLQPHIQEMLGFDGFLKAHWYRPDPVEESNKEDVVLWTIHYHLRHREDFDNYCAMHAARMRADGLQRFPNVFSATRRLLDIHQDFI